MAGDHIIDFYDRTSADAPEIEAYDRIFRPAAWRLRGSLGWDGREFSFYSFLNHTAGYEDDRGANEVRVSSWTTVDITAAYEIDAPGKSLLDGTRFAVSVQNLFDKNPPFVLSDSLNGPGNSAAGYDPANANPFGRLISLQLVKRW